MSSPGRSINRKTLYRLCQYGGWSVYILLNAVFLFLRGNLNLHVSIGLLGLLLMGILLTEALRRIIIRMNWLRLPPVSALPRVLGANIVMGAILELVQLLIELAVNRGFSDGNGGTHVRFALGVLNFTFVFFFWSLIYFSVHYIENYKRAEIEGLRWQALSRETELNRLKSQLNPHFMFNAMNSIRALVDENPAQAKQSVTQLSNILRSTLQLGKTKLIPLSQELELVRDYLALEAVRLEERLRLEWHIAPGTETIAVPPLMLQTLMENGIKHGISKLPEGGFLSLETKLHDDAMEILMRNSGTLDLQKKPESGHGISNTHQRLDLLYGNRATFSIAQENETVVLTRLWIPKALQL